jgi:outer membrane protein TolC
MKHIATYIAIVLLFLNKINAQENLSLAEAIKIALENNFKMRAAQDNLAIARNNNNWGEAGRWPSFDLIIGQNNTMADPSRNPQSFIRDKFYTAGVSLNASVNWVLFSGFRVNLTKERLELLQAQSEGNAVMVMENTIQSVILAYYNAVLQIEKLQVIKDVAKLSKDKYEYFLQKKDLGTNSTFELLQYKNAMLADSTNALIQELAVNNSLRNLNLLMGQDSEKKYLLTDFLQTPDIKFTPEELKELVKKNNSSLVNQYINLQLQKTAIELAQSAMYPVISFSLGTNNQFSYFKTSLFEGNATNLNYYANFTINFNIFNGGKTRRAIQNARIQEKIVQTNYDEMEFTVINQLQNLYELFLTRKKILRLSSESFQSAETNLQLAEERFKSGTINSFNKRDIDLAYLNAALVRLESAYNLIDVHTELLRISGGLVEIGVKK